MQRKETKQLLGFLVRSRPLVGLSNFSVGFSFYPRFYFEKVKTQMISYLLIERMIWSSFSPVYSFSFPNRMI